MIEITVTSCDKEAGAEETESEEVVNILFVVCLPQRRSCLGNDQSLYRVWALGIYFFAPLKEMHMTVKDGEKAFV